MSAYSPKYDSNAASELVMLLNFLTATCRLAISACDGIEPLRNLLIVAFKDCLTNGFTPPLIASLPIVSAVPILGDVKKSAITCWSTAYFCLESNPEALINTGSP